MMRPFATADFPDYLALSREFYASEATDHPVPEDHFHRTFAESLGNTSPLARAWLVTADDGRAVGYLLASLTWSTEFGGRVAWLEELYLRPEARGQGLGRRVLEAGMKELRERDGARGFRLEVAPANEAVSVLYHKLGFAKVPYQGWWRTA